LSIGVIHDGDMAHASSGCASARVVIAFTNSHSHSRFGEFSRAGCAHNACPDDEGIKGTLTLCIQ
jgi:hypothetical protein